MCDFKNGQLMNNNDEELCHTDRVSFATITKYECYPRCVFAPMESVSKSKMTVESLGGAPPRLSTVGDVADCRGTGESAF